MAVASEPTAVRLLTVSELARMLHVGRSTVYRWVRDGTVPSVRIGRIVRFDMDDVQRALKRHSTTA